MAVEFELLTGNILVAKISGELDHHNAAAIRTKIDSTMEAFNSTHLVFDLSDLEFMDSSGIGMVLGRHNKIKGKNGLMYVTDMSPYMEKILHMAGVFTLVRKKESAEEAIAEIAKEAR